MKTWSDEAQLIAKCKRELPYNHASFEVLVERYKDIVYTLCYRLVGGTSDAEDLTQEVFTKIFLNLKNFEARSKFSSWVYRIVHNHCINFLTRSKREKNVMGEYTQEKKRTDKIELSGDVSVILQDALNKLSVDQRTILIMKYVIGLEIKDISETLEITNGAVKMRLKRSKTEFKKYYKPERV